MEEEKVQEEKVQTEEVGRRTTTKSKNKIYKKREKEQKEDMRSLRYKQRKLHFAD